MEVHGHTTMVDHVRPCFVKWPPMVDQKNGVKYQLNSQEFKLGIYTSTSRIQKNIFIVAVLTYTPQNNYCGYGMTIPQKISLTFNKADNGLPIFFTNSLVNWKVDSQLFKEPLS